MRLTLLTHRSLFASKLMMVWEKDLFSKTSTLTVGQIWHLITRSSQPCHVRFKIFTPAGCSSYLEILKVPDNFKAPEQCGHLRLVDPVGLRWQGPDAHLLQMIWDTPASNCDTLVMRYVVWMYLICRGVAFGLNVSIHAFLKVQPSRCCLMDVNNANTLGWCLLCQESHCSWLPISPCSDSQYLTCIG